MKNLVRFFWICSGADTAILEKCPSEKTKYVGIGATVFFTGIFAALAGGYALNMAFDNLWIAVPFALVWGLMIFNLDRYIVSSMRKEGKFYREFLLALPRIILAVVISLVIAKPLELKIFEKEIQTELAVMEQHAFARQDRQVRARFDHIQDSLKREIQTLQTEMLAKASKRDELVRIAQEEADGTGGSKRRNLGPIYKVKKADADRADAELNAIYQQNTQNIQRLQLLVSRNDSLLTAEIASLNRGKLNGPAARLDALNRIAKTSSPIYFANLFILLLFIAIETAPVFVKLISPKGPYDNLLKIEEHSFVAMEVEHMAVTNAAVKGRTATLPNTETTFVTQRLDAALKQS